MQIKNFRGFLAENQGSDRLTAELDELTELHELGILSDEEYIEKSEPMWNEIGRRVRMRMQSSEQVPLSAGWLQELAQDPELGRYADLKTMVEHSIIDPYRVYSELVKGIAQRLQAAPDLEADLRYRTAPGRINKPQILLARRKDGVIIGAVEWRRIARDHGPTIIKPNGSPEIWLEVELGDNTKKQFRIEGLNANHGSAPIDLDSDIERVVDWIRLAVQDAA